MPLKNIGNYQWSINNIYIYILSTIIRKNKNKNITIKIHLYYLFFILHNLYLKNVQKSPKLKGNCVPFLICDMKI